MKIDWVLVAVCSSFFVGGVIGGFIGYMLTWGICT